MTLHITAEHSKCIASGACVLASPDVFDQDDDGIVMILDASPDESLRESVADAVHACPARVLSVQG